MTKRGYHVFVAYSDIAAGEIGTVYQASNWLYCGTFMVEIVRLS